MIVLVACEESQRVCSAFRARGYEAYSCDIIDPSGGYPEWHIKQDVLSILNPIEQFYLEPISGDLSSKKCIQFSTMDGKKHIVPKWDLIIAHPPCTYLTVTGNRWFNVEKYGDKARERIKLREEAKEFFMAFANADCDHIAIENPVGVMSTSWRKPDQYVEPYWFGDPYQKRTCLWLKGLPKLKATDIVEPEARIVYKSGSSLPAWYADASKLSPAERSRIRSQTFPGFAEAMAEQWSFYLDPITT